MREEIKKYITNLSDEDRLLLVRKQTNACLGWLKKRNKASESEFNNKGDRGGRNSSKNQTLYANSFNTARLYDSSLEDLKDIIKLL